MIQIYQLVIFILNFQMATTLMTTVLPSSVIIGASFFKKPDYQRPKTNFNCINYFKPWYDSIHRLNLHGVLLYDNLHLKIISKYQTNLFTFHYVNTRLYSQQLWAGDWRLLAALSYLENRTYIKYVTLTDVSDVTFNKNPVEFFQKHPEKKLFFSFEAAGNRDWMQIYWKKCLSKKYPVRQTKIYAVGMFAGEYSYIVQHLNLTKYYLLSSVLKIGSGTCDMITHNLAIYNFWTNKSIIWEEGQPLYNKIKTIYGEPGEPSSKLSLYYMVHQHRTLKC